MEETNQKQITSLSTFVSAVMKRVYLKMTAALAVTAIVAFYCAQSMEIMQFLFSHSWLFYGLILGELALVIGISAGIRKMSSTQATLLFYLYSVVTGVVFSSIFIVYTGASIFKTFTITSVVFGVMSLFGYTTKSDLTRIGSFLFMALIALIVISVINIFMASSTMDWIISFAGVAIFIGLTAWDTQKIKQMAAESDSITAEKLAVVGALSLYLDFINLFLYLLRFFGSSRD